MSERAGNVRALPCPVCGGSGIAPKPRRGTWRDWLPDGMPEPPESELLTREELAEWICEQVDDEGDGDLKVSAGDLRFWEYEGVLPHAVRRWHNGAVRTRYPLWMGWLAIYIRCAQAESGCSLEKIARRIPQEARYLLGPGAAHGA